MTMTVEELKAEDAIRAKTKKTYWESEKDGKKLTIVRKPDRTPLLILYLHDNKQQQLCQLQLKYFGDTDLEDSTTQMLIILSVTSVGVWRVLLGVGGVVVYGFAFTTLP